MDKKKSVLSGLLKYINGAYKKDANYHIALKLLTEYKKIPNMTIIETSELCNVSTASVSRFIRLLGYETFSEFKTACSNALDIRSTDYSAMVLKANKEDIESIFERYTNSVLENIKFTYDNIDYQQIDHICQMLFESNDIALFGSEFSSLLGLHLQNRMSLMNKYVKIGFSYEKQLEIAKSLKQNAVVIVATIEGGYFYRNAGIIDALKEKNANAKIIVLTMNIQNKLMKEVDEVIICSKQNNDTEGRISLLYTMEVIIMYYCINYSHI